jgi:hypothetical protein
MGPVDPKLRLKHEDFVFDDSPANPKLMNGTLSADGEKEWWLDFKYVE